MIPRSIALRYRPDAIEIHLPPPLRFYLPASICHKAHRSAPFPCAFRATHENFCSHHFYIVWFAPRHKITILRDKNDFVAGLSVWNQRCDNLSISVLAITWCEITEVMKGCGPAVLWQSGNCPQVSSACLPEVLALCFFLSTSPATTCGNTKKSVGKRWSAS